MDNPPDPEPGASAEAKLAGLRLQVEELRQAVRARDDFIAIAAHELRNPMTPIVGLAELALAAAHKAQGNCPPRLTEFLERLQHTVQDYIRRATRLLDVSRIEAGNLRLEPAAMDLSALVHLVVQRYQVTARRGGSALVLDIEDGIAGVWDRLAVEQIVENLLSNALKYGQGKPVTVRLGSAPGMAELEVRDRGIGMSADQQARIFGRFEQVMTEHRGSGFGVGLWVAHRLVTAMDGRIAVASSVGQGSSFTLTLPRAPQAPDRTLHDPG